MDVVAYAAAAAAVVPAAFVPARGAVPALFATVPVPGHAHAEIVLRVREHGSLARAAD